MKKVFILNFEPGSRNSNEPRSLREIMTEIFQSNSPLAEGYRKYLTSKEKGAMTW